MGDSRSMLDEMKISQAEHLPPVAARVVVRRDEVCRIREAAGCFVLLTNAPPAGEMSHTPEEVLAAYKEQHGIERNFSFLKDPLILNDLFLKRPDRIEVLGFILLASLLVWNLMEHVMREYLRQTDSTIPGWDRKPTSKPPPRDSCNMLRALKSCERQADHALSSFQAAIDPDLCVSCGTCQERCQIEAIVEGEDYMEVDLDRCIRCGLCVRTCQEEAVTMVANPGAKEPPANFLEMQMKMAAERGLL